MIKIYNLILFCSLLNVSIGQVNEDYLTLDSLVFHKVRIDGSGYNAMSSTDTCTFKSVIINDGLPHYYINCVEVDKSTYLKIKEANKSMNKCKPCVMTNLGPTGKIISISTQYTDCMVGDYKEFYENGNIKIKGQYKKNPKKNWRGLYRKGNCSVRVGEWIYYSKDGSILKTENYKNGVLLKK